MYVYFCLCILLYMIYFVWNRFQVLARLESCLEGNLVMVLENQLVVVNVILFAGEIVYAEILQSMGYVLALWIRNLNPENVFPF